MSSTPLDLKKYAPLKDMPLNTFVVTWTRSFEHLPDPCPEANPLITALIHDGPTMLEELERWRELGRDIDHNINHEEHHWHDRLAALLPTEGEEA